MHVIWSWYGTLDRAVYVCPSFVALLKIKINETLPGQQHVSLFY